MKNKQRYHTVGTIQISNIKIVERGKMRDGSFSLLCTGTSIKRSGVKT